MKYILIFLGFFCIPSLAFSDLILDLRNKQSDKNRYVMSDDDVERLNGWLKGLRGAIWRSEDVNVARHVRTFSRQHEYVVSRKKDSHDSRISRKNHDFSEEIWVQVNCDIQYCGYIRFGIYHTESNQALTLTDEGLLWVFYEGGLPHKLIRELLKTRPDQEFDPLYSMAPQRIAFVNVEDLEPNSTLEQLREKMNLPEKMRYWEPGFVKISPDYPPAE